MIRKHIIFSGWVQGVGFRYRLHYASDLYGVTGWVKNNFDGTVEAEMQGEEKDIDSAIMTVEKGTYIKIENLWANEIPLIENEHGFYIK